MALKMILAFLTSLLTGVTLRTPSSAWLTVGFTGMLGWTVSQILAEQNVPDLLTAVSGGIVVGAMAEILARLQKHPVTVYIVSGIIPLVPGITAYSSMREFLNKQFTTGAVLAFKAFLIASYLAAGLAIMPLIVRNIRVATSRCKGIKVRGRRR